MRVIKPGDPANPGSRAGAVTRSADQTDLAVLDKALLDVRGAGTKPLRRLYG